MKEKKDRQIVFLIGERSRVLEVTKRVEKARTTSFVSPVFEALQTMFKLDKEYLAKWDLEFKTPIVITEHHIRRFRGLMEGGVFAVQNYAGKKIHSTKDLVDYFMLIVTRNMPNILIEKFDDLYQTLPSGINLIIDIDPRETERVAYRSEIEKYLSVSVESDFDAEITLDDAENIDKLLDALTNNGQEKADNGRKIARKKREK